MQTYEGLNSLSGILSSAQETKPASKEIAQAVSMLSPVHIRTLMPDLWHCVIASLMPGRNGSIRPKIHDIVKFDSNESELIFSKSLNQPFSIPFSSAITSHSSLVKSRYETARQRQHFLAKLFKMPSLPKIVSLISSVNSTLFPSSAIASVQSTTIASVAPFTNKRTPSPSSPSRRIAVVYRLRFESKGISATIRFFLDSSIASIS